MVIVFVFIVRVDVLKDVLSVSFDQMFQGCVLGVSIIILLVGVGQVLIVWVCGVNLIIFGIFFLYVVDGVFIELGNFFYLVNVNVLVDINLVDIVFMDVLKDVVVVVLYGLCVVNGVILIIIK